MSEWGVRVPGYPVWVMYGATEKDIRMQIRATLYVGRVPRGTQIDRVDDEKKGGA